MKYLKINYRPYFVIILIITILSSCNAGKMEYDFERGKKLDFTTGKWLLNKPETVDGRTETIEDIARNEFMDIISKDRLIEIFELRKNNLVGHQIPHSPTQADLKELKLVSNCDFLINVRNEIIGENEGSFRFSRSLGVSKKVNMARTEIEIYDLNSSKLISKSSAIAKDEVIERENSGFEYLTSGILLANKSVSKLIRKYKKHKKD
ncbi:hypothetical protein LB465_02875 [Salegentibacter sp. LM13S]|uniref:hypothetical protein n=1 Tax=Salegentibacter lacus TaxID=2873599 RepID=UPI001CCB8585|nr:hypothetical protein [Salegentibacter lacus]MBZ9629709.1 hypothetical protein [Salegentibacter lacus]